MRNIFSQGRVVSPTISERLEWWCAWTNKIKSLSDLSSVLEYLLDNYDNKILVFSMIDFIEIHVCYI